MEDASRVSQPLVDSKEPTVRTVCQLSSFVLGSESFRSFLYRFDYIPIEEPTPSLIVSTFLRSDFHNNKHVFLRCEDDARQRKVGPPCMYKHTQ